MNSEQQYIDIYNEQRDVIFEHSSDVMNAVRDKAFERFKANRFPTQKVERYKYTDLQKLFEPDYGLNLRRLNIPVDPYQAFRCDVPNLSTSLFFVVNDIFYRGERSDDRGERREERGERNDERGERKEESGERNDSRGERKEESGERNDSRGERNLPKGVIVGSLNEQISLLSPLSSLLSPLSSLLSKDYNSLAGKDGDAVTDLNTMLAQDALLVYVPRGVKVERAIQVVNILRSDVPLMVNRRVLIIAEEGAEVTLLFCDHAADDHAFLTTQVIEVFAKDNATVNLYCLEETHYKNVRVSNVYIDQQRSSRVTHNVITLHNGITRNKLDLTLNGDGAECECLGCVIADKQQHVDNNTLITHHATHCTSNELYKYVLNDQSTGAFAGRVLVEHGAQQTNSQMTNQNLCSSPDAHIYTQPMLEIYADDVKCAHGSTIGQLNDQALFYMQQRGIPRKEARTLLEVAFINQVIEGIRLVPLRDRLHYLVEKRFRGELSKCKGCQLCR